MLIPPMYEPAIAAAFAEDLAAQDLTTDATVDPTITATAIATAKSDLVVCGGEVFFATFKKLDPSCQITRHLQEGSMATASEAVWSVSGNARCLLMAERTALNFAQRMSGVATLTRRYVDALPADATTRITDTRKTTPGLRALERYAVRVGGGHNHRDSLGTAVLIKDNHIIAAGGIEAAVAGARRLAPHSAKIEIEVADQSMLKQALAAGADIIMLDNFNPADIASAVAECRGKALVEASGGVGLDRVAELATAGVDVISVGALTHSAPAADISLGIRLDA